MKENVKIKWHRRLSSLPFLVFVFFICCVTGWIYEVSFDFFAGNGFVNRGFLYGPYLPVYGFGGIFGMSLLLKFTQKKPLGRLGTPIAAFFLFGLLSSLLELITGLILENLFHMRMWDYSIHWLNFNGLISPFSSLRFALGGLLLLYGVCPLVSRFCHAVRQRVQNILAAAVCIVMLLDTAVSFMLRYS